MDIDNNLERELYIEIKKRDEQITELVMKIKELEHRIVCLETRTQMPPVYYYT